MTAIIGIFILALIAQGGFFSSSYLIVGIISTMVLIFKVKKVHYCREIILLGIIAVFYIISMFVNGISHTTICHAFQPLVCLVISYCFMNFKENEKEYIINAVRYIGLISSVLAVFIFIFNIDIFGMINNGRLQFFFQYANTAGLWFGVVFILCKDATKKTIKYCSVISLIALLLAKSVGVITVFVILQLIWALQNRQIWNEKHNNKKSYRRMLMIVIGVFTFAGGGLVIWQRASEAIFTFAERIIQSLDGMKVIFNHPFLGIGPGRWGDLYPYYQSAQYRASVVHNSYVQIGLDAGIIPVIIMLALLIIVIKNYMNKKTVRNEAVLLIMLHSIMDYSLSFAAIDILLIILILSDKDNVRIYEMKNRVGLKNIMAIICIMIFSIGWLGEHDYIESLKNSRVKTYMSPYQNFVITLGTKECNVDKAILIIKGQPYNYELIEQITQIADKQNWNQNEIKKYNMEINKLNLRLHINHAAWLNNQKEYSKLTSEETDM